METTIKSVRVFDVIVDIDHFMATSHVDIGTIFFIDINDKGINRVTSSHTKTDTAKPLFSFIKKYPLRGEIVTVITSQGAGHPAATETYYLPPLNIYNHPHHGAFLHTEEILESKPSYGLTQVGIIQKTLKSKGLDIKLGNYFKELENIRPLQPYEGDTILEGRFGNSIRFGATTDPTVSIANNWSNEGEIGNPITIIRNGQKKNINTQEYKFISENINQDDSSIYLTSNQQLTDFSPSSIHFKSWGANLETTKQTILSPIINKQTEPEIVEQEITDEEEPVTIEPITPLPEEIEEEITEDKTFEDSSNVNEVYTDTNTGITPSSNIILNKGTLKYKIINEENDPEFVEFQEITNGLDQPIGANFTLKHLIISEQASNPTFGIHEDAELERVGIYFSSTGTSPTGVVQGYFIRDILGFYIVEEGWSSFVSIKDSDMNEIHKTQEFISSTPIEMIEFAENAIFNGGTYYDYNMPNPGINNYPGIDSDLISGDDIVSNLKKVIENCIDKIIEVYPELEIVSAYRSTEIDSNINPSSNSDHVKGLAIDFKVPGINTSELFNWCFENLEEWKDLMWAYPEREADSWIHISYEEGKNEKHTTLASEIDSIHEYYESNRRGEMEQYQDGILMANQELV